MVEDNVHKRQYLEEGILEEIMSGNRCAIWKIEQDLKVNNTNLIKGRVSFQETRR